MYGSVDGEPSHYAELIRPAYQGGRFNRTRSVNQYLTHWIYPYRGKFHPQMVRALLNILGVHPGAKVLEIYLGSGTTAIEASLLGADVVGIDLSPLCVLLTRVKTLSWMAVDEICEVVRRLLETPELHPDRVQPSRRWDPRVADFVEVARIVTYSDVARRGRQAEPAFRRNLSAMLELSLYNEDMKQTFSEVARVLKPGAGAAFVVGDATVDGREETTTNTMAQWAEAAGLVCERRIPKIVFGLYNVMNDERILVFRKPH